MSGPENSFDPSRPADKIFPGAENTMSPREFEKLVKNVFESLPPMFREHLAHVELVVEDWPDQDLVDDLGLGDDEALYGIYEGEPLTESRSVEDGAPIPVMPTIRIFRKELEQDFPNREELVEQIRITVIHEVGHHFGLDDDAIDKLGFG